MEKNKKLNILISAYYCDPYRGGELSLRWNFSKTTAQQHHVWVLTKSTNKPQIEAEMAKNPVANLSFVYYEVPQNKLFTEQRAGEQLYYIIWQMFAIKAYKEISKTIEFDLVHHLTFNQYRTPSIGFFVKKPFIMGPVGGAEIIDPVFFQDLTRMSKLKERWRSLGLDRYLLGFISRLRSNSKTFVFSSSQNYKNLKKHVGKKHTSLTIPAIAINKADFAVNTENGTDSAEKPFTIIYAGTAKDWKGLAFFLRALGKTFNAQDKVLVKLIGIRNEQENIKVLDWIKENDLSEIVQTINFMPREQLIKALSVADLSVYPAFRDSGSMSVLEACALYCPVICFDAGGQDAFPDDIILKVPVSAVSYDENVNSFSQKLKWAFNNREELKNLGTKAGEYVFEQFSWEKKVELFCKLYDDLIEQ